LTTVKLNQIWKNEYFKTAAMFILIIVIFFGAWFSSQIFLNTQYPALAVASGSMCTLYGPYCDGWTHPFETTLHIGDLIIVQGTDSKDIKAAPYPDGDIIVFRRPQAGNELIVHRAIEKRTINGKIFFETKGDGNASPDQDLVPEDNVVGKVILRIPWIGHLALFMHNSFFGTLLIIFLIIILIIIEFVIPASTGTEIERKKTGKSF
jgi:signal peptidase